MVVYFHVYVYHAYPMTGRNETWNFEHCNTHGYSSSFKFRKYRPYYQKKKKTLENAEPGNNKYVYAMLLIRLKQLCTSPPNPPPN